MTNTRFYEEAGKVAHKLGNIAERVRRTMEVLERLVHSEEVNISSWAVRAGKIYITFDAIAELEHGPENENKQKWQHSHRVTPNNTNSSASCRRSFACHSSSNENTVLPVKRLIYKGSSFRTSAAEHNGRKRYSFGIFPFF